MLEEQNPRKQSFLVAKNQMFLSESELNMGFSKDKIATSFKIRNSKYKLYTLSLRDCGTHNTIYDGNHTFLIDFERACFSYPSDELASLIVEEIIPEEIMLKRYLSKSINGHKYNDREFNLELCSSLFEKSLEILTYFKTGKGNISEAKRESIFNKYINLVTKYYERLCQNLDKGIMNKKQDVEEFYDNIASSYGTEHKDRFADKILEYFVLHNIPKQKNLKILDLGSGIGRFAKPLLERGHEVTLVEISVNMLNESKKELINFSNASFHVASATNLSEFKENSFVLCL